MFICRWVYHKLSNISTRIFRWVHQTWRILDQSIKKTIKRGYIPVSTPSIITNMVIFRSVHRKLSNMVLFRWVRQNVQRYSSAGSSTTNYQTCWSTGGSTTNNQLWSSACGYFKNYWSHSQTIRYGHFRVSLANPVEELYLWVNSTQTVKPRYFCMRSLLEWVHHKL